MMALSKASADGALPSESVSESASESASTSSSESATPSASATNAPCPPGSFRPRPWTCPLNAAYALPQVSGVRSIKFTSNCGDYINFVEVSTAS